MDKQDNFQPIFYLAKRRLARITRRVMKLFLGISKLFHGVVLAKPFPAFFKPHFCSISLLFAELKTVRRKVKVCKDWNVSQPPQGQVKPAHRHRADRKKHPAKQPCREADFANCECQLRAADHTFSIL